MNDQLGPLPPHRKVTAHGRVWIEEDMLAYGRQERAAERMMTQGFLEEIERMRAALTWALGANGDFRQQGAMEGTYWWRGELAERSGLEWDGVRYVSKGPNAEAQRQ